MWGGLYDHVPPPVADGIGYGYRVPNLVISPYAKRGMVDHEQADLCAPLKFISDNWGLPYLTDRIAATHNFEHAFAFGRNPRKDARPAPEMACFGSPWSTRATPTGPRGRTPTRRTSSSRARSRCLRRRVGLAR